MGYDGGSTVRRRRRGGGGLPNPLTIFGSRLMWWHSLADRSTLFQDAAGTTPVTALNDPIGLILDKSKGLVLGSELATNGDFATGDFTGFTTGGGWAVSGNEATLNSNNPAFYLRPTVSTTNWRVLTFTLTRVTAGFLDVRGNNPGYAVIAGPYSAPGTFTVYIPPGQEINFLRSSVTFNGAIDNISVKEILGNHAFQATSASRPLWKQDGNGCYNSLFDGTDDSWATAAIDLSASDKVAVFAAVRKLSDAARGILVSTGTVAGTFEVNAPPSGLSGYACASLGTLSSLSSVSGYTAPITNVLCCIFDIGADTNILRVNAAQVASVSTDQGTGNYTSQVLQIGRRGGSTLPFNGQIYEDFGVLGAVTAAEIAAAEAYLNSVSKAY